MLARVTDASFCRTVLRIPEADQELLDAQANLAAETNAVARLTAKRAGLEDSLIDNPTRTRQHGKSQIGEMIVALDRDEIAPARAKEAKARKLVDELAAKRTVEIRAALNEPINAYGAALQTKFDELAELLAIGVALDAEARLQKIDLASALIRGSGTLLEFQIKHRALLQKWRVEHG